MQNYMHDADGDKRMKLGREGHPILIFLSLIVPAV